MISIRLENWQLKNKWCVLRIDANIDLEAGRGYERLSAIIDTLSYVKEKGGRVIMLMHMGRPTKFENRLSTAQLLPWFTKHGFQFAFSPKLPEKTLLLDGAHDGIVVENIRMLSVADSEVHTWYESVKKEVPYYINDAWGSMHRNDWSLVFLPLLFSKDSRSAGFLAMREMGLLDSILASGKHVGLLLAGGKGEEKIKSINASHPFFSHLFLGPLASFYRDSLDQGKFEVHLPKDYVASTAHKKLEIISPEEARKRVVVSIGPETIRAYIREMEKMEWIVINGLMGVDQVPGSFEMMGTLIVQLLSLANNKLFCGGDTVSFAQNIRVQQPIQSQAGIYFSTGGGSTLAYLGRQPLPALEIIS
jgi:3-phosphoglycerate kinase